MGSRTVHEAIKEASSAAAGGIDLLAAEAGFEFGTIQAWGRGTRHPGPEELDKLAAALHRRSTWLGNLASELERAATALDGATAEKRPVHSRSRADPHPTAPEPGHSARRR